MSNRILIIAHAPLAQALRDCALHVYAECSADVVAIDVQADAQPEDTLIQAIDAAGASLDTGLLVLTDIFGATPANVAQKLVAGSNAKLIAGVNLPMLYRAVCYRHEPLDALVARALTGGTQGVMQVAITAPQNQNRRIHDQNHNDNQQ
ncbi:MAG: PTS fructose transporter subunit IIA [Burkholderiales bacterium 35-55-47]|jgi:PTS system ascorbate-specific IIA component|uniref:PTS sugar transporter subunit IIA n=1 Tax=Limnohabitans sp. TaxID=1907725 RepID=UPI000BDA76BE|nr:PTS fructose transporter subunit IIA [Limnohabitans sp.]OYY17763.1 MAG: PTS fructose transporter subunit IIA [Burkholderiales bacterium 35-55-47]OYZ72302.1 MAG: PTS fructose transporter subunit IIA [Burkholderiales bacterium 24-55-52]OZA99674.1 MAG: PTS fructose transporter subunit IIA [Burkholderiales bacterium 39-55-53]HQR86719.1 PTS fructose transporter subunit IIA [Limnohabitans sp.]HQS27184.1 PTS fructose transporter subunit IIA [Limnohabitans sp.]